MKDGRQVDFGVRGKLKKNIEIVGEGVSRLIKLTIDVVNGDTHVLEFNADHPLFFELAAHGASQKITDSVTKAEDGDDISICVANQIEKLNNGNWSQRSSGDSLIRGFADLYEAIRRIKGYEVDSVEALKLRRVLAEKPEAELKNYKSNPNIKVFIAQIQSEKALAKAAKSSSSQETDFSEFDL